MPEFFYCDRSAVGATSKNYNCNNFFFLITRKLVSVHAFLFCLFCTQYSKNVGFSNHTEVFEHVFARRRPR